MANIRIVECNRCEHEWATKNPEDPKRCPKCNSPYWNKERIRKIGFKKGGKK